MAEPLKDVIMKRDGMSSNEADDLINEAKQAILDGEDPEEVLEDYFGLELDYILDILP